jgi:glyoxylase-like metal-dependent hydrolase (beta-lactamase superfamily II)
MLFFKGMGMQQVRAFGHGIYAVDSAYTGPGVAAIHLIEHGGRAALVDTGNNAALHHVEQALKETGLSPEAVDYVLLTHIHLDHAGGAGAFMQAFPNAKLVVHPRGARHMVEPSKLFAGVSAVYGPERAKELYGELIPVPADRASSRPPKGHELNLAGRVIRVFDTPGHARHHVCLLRHRRAAASLPATPSACPTGPSTWMAGRASSRPPRRCSSSPTRCTRPSPAWRPSSRRPCTSPTTPR